jgi:2-amino-4-hydroxy-6-hydroxymethyldihydropteridine diphosphokinase
LAALGRIAGVSNVYASPAVGPAGQPDFLNAAILIETHLAPDAVRDRLRAIEAELGRVRTSDRFAPRPVDLDLVLYDDLVLDSPPLRIPDPDLLDRGYLAVTISELDPGFTHPETGETLAAIAGKLRAENDLVPRPEIDLGSPTEPADRSSQGSRRPA